VTGPSQKQTPVVVGIGASAGGLEAFSRLLESLPVDTGMAFVLVQHLDPKHPSLLTHLLSGKTAMAISEATDGVGIAADHVYVVPPGSDMLINNGQLRLTPREQTPQLHLPIDAFLRSLAEDGGERAIGIVLSGAASDGAKGLAAIKSAGGVTFAQTPSSAEYASMPASAIAARVVDFVLPPDEIARELARLAADFDDAGPGVLRVPEADAVATYDDVFALLRGAFRVDFSAYKLPTIRRRIARRMLVRRSADLEEYVSLLGADPAEVEALYRDILIMVTEFFREPETFAVLRERVFPAILQEKPVDAGVRIWVPGCASGEETYSLAITLLEVMGAQGVDVPVKIFATDISEPDLASARRGSYAESISSAVAPDVLRRYFAHTEGGYQISKAVRELCVFARHDVTRDPPFANLDLVSCRNLLIYLGSALQRWVIPSLHYGLLPEGYLVLGRSESIGGFTELFETVDQKHKVFRKLSPGSAAGLFRFPITARDEPAQRAGRTPLETNDAAQASRPTTRQEADKAVLASFVPAGATVDSQLAVVEFRGDTGPYLANRPGRPSLNLLDMMGEDLRGTARAALAEAERTGAKVLLKGIRISKGTSKQAIDLHVIPFTSQTGERHFVVLFEELAPTGGGVGKAAGARKDVAAAREADILRDELVATRERLEAVIQDKEAANEELRAANEEMLSNGEEMQSINEELETTQEELQSTNQELLSRNLELGQVGDDLRNLLASASFPIIMVDRNLRIRRFTPAAERLLKVVASDVGRLISDLRLRIDVPDLEALLREVIDTMALRERDVQDDEGRWYAMQLRPYKTSDNRIDGAVMTLFDIDEMTRLFVDQKSVATVLQQHYIRSLPKIPGLELAAVAETAHHRDLIGGDFHDAFCLPDGKAVILIGDVAGKGVEAAGLAETVRIAVRATALVSPSPEEVLSNVHRLVADISERFVTALIVILDPATGEAVLASAGHPPPVRLSEAGCDVLEPQPGPPLGAFEPAYVPRRFSLARGDALVLYTDGVIEARRNGELFEEQRLVEALCGHGHRDPQMLVDRLRAAVVKFTDALRDDLHIVALRRT
jgi:two-component system CheB/CheR fusion protein